MNPGDRIEVRFTFAHSGTTSGFNLQMNWGNTDDPRPQRLGAGCRGGGRAPTPRITATGAQVSVESWGTVLPFLPGILNAPVASRISKWISGPRSQRRARIASTLTNYTVLRYPGN